jgi:predicted 3-demethylubiquinone-9 3-methyltransferase (glyoxalase superfamily)
MRSTGSEKKRAMKALLKMKRIDVKKLRNAAAGK